MSGVNKPTAAVWACLSLQLEMAGCSSLLVRNDQGRTPPATTLPVLEFSGGQLCLVPTGPRAPSPAVCLILTHRADLYSELLGLKCHSEGGARLNVSHNGPPRSESHPPQGSGLGSHGGSFVPGG